MYSLSFLSVWLYYSYPLLFKHNILGQNERNTWLKNNYTRIKKLFVWLLGLTVFIAIMLYKQFQKVEGRQLILLTVILVFALLYNNVALLGRQKIPRTNPWLKPATIAIVWAGAGVFFPCSMNNYFSSTLIYFFLLNVLFIFCLSVVFDIKDMEQDKQDNIKSLVLLLGIQKVKQFFLYPICGLIAVLNIILWFSNSPFSIINFLSFIPLFLLILLIKKWDSKKSTLHYFIFIDGLLFIKGVIGIIIPFIRYNLV